MTLSDELAKQKMQILRAVRQVLKTKTPSGYSLNIPENGVMLVSDGLTPQHERWYVVVVPEPEHIADTRKHEYLRILSEVEEEIQRKGKRTVYLSSMLPIL